MKHPNHLHPDSVKKYDELHKRVEKILQDGDEDLLAVLANTYGDYVRAHKELTARGIVMGGKTMTRKNPAFEIVKDCIGKIETLSTHFGFSPKARGEKFGGKDADDKDDLDKI